MDERHSERVPDLGKKRRFNFVRGRQGYSYAYYWILFQQPYVRAGLRNTRPRVDFSSSLPVLCEPRKLNTVMICLALCKGATA